MKRRSKGKLSKSGYALLTAIVAVNIFAIMILKARSMWETELQRDLEEELIFRGRQYVTAIELYMLKNGSAAPQNLDVLFEKKFLRKRFKDPMNGSEKWNVIMRSPGISKDALLVVPEDMVPQFVSQATIIGVASSSTEEGFKVYRRKKKYCEWAFYIGEEEGKEMPELKFMDGSNPSSSDNSDEGSDEKVEDKKTDPSGRGENIDNSSGDDEGTDERDMGIEEDGRQKKPGRG